MHRMVELAGWEAAQPDAKRVPRQVTAGKMARFTREKREKPLLPNEFTRPDNETDRVRIWDGGDLILRLCLSLE